MILAKGMFVDGVVYSTIARNLAQDIGSFWFLHYTSTLYPSFHEHPPLGLFIQSLVFRIVGDHFFLERLYSIATYFITGFLMLKIWKLIIRDSAIETGWFPLALWISVPLIWWGASNNMLENSLSVFTTFSVLLYVKNLIKSRSYLVVFSGVFMLAGLLTKGPVALFPLSMPFWTLVFIKGVSVRKFFKDTTLLMMGILIPAFFIGLIWPESIISIQEYFSRQIMGRLVEEQTAGYRLYILWRFFNEIIPALIMVLLTVLILRRKLIGDKADPANRQWSKFLMALSLSAVIPLMITLKQSGYYLLPAFPIAILALALIAQKSLRTFAEQLKSAKTRRLVLILSILLFCFSAFNSARFYGELKRDKKALSDVLEISKYVPQGSTLAIEKTLYENWALHAYLMRYAYISLDPDQPHAYLLTDAKSDIASIQKELLIPASDSAYSLIPATLNSFCLYKVLP